MNMSKSTLTKLRSVSLPDIPKYFSFEVDSNFCEDGKHSDINSSVEELVKITRKLTACNNFSSALRRQQLLLNELPCQTPEVNYSIVHTESKSVDEKNSYNNREEMHILEAIRDNDVFEKKLHGSSRDLKKKYAFNSSASTECLSYSSNTLPPTEWRRFLEDSSKDINCACKNIKLKENILAVQAFNEQVIENKSNFESAAGTYLDNDHFQGEHSFSKNSRKVLQNSKSLCDDESLNAYLFGFRFLLPFRRRFLHEKSLHQTQLIRFIASGKPSYQDVHMWRMSFEALLKDKYGRALFKSFLSTEFSEENIEFWIACEEYKSVPQLKKKKILARKIFSEFVAPRSSREVNLDSVTKAQTEVELINPTSQTFENAQKRIQALMERDSYRRFIRSDLYSTLFKEAKHVAQELARTARNAPEQNLKTMADSANISSNLFKLSQMKIFGSGNKGSGVSIPGVLAAAADAEVGINSIPDLQHLGLSTSRHMQIRSNLSTTTCKCRVSSSGLQSHDEVYNDENSDLNNL